jgi:hypothetical protein
MSTALLIAQTTAKDSSSSATIVFGMLALVGILSVLALTTRGRRSLMPVIAVLLGIVITYTSVSDALNATFSIITVLGMLIGATLVLGGLGALREGVALPPVEGRDPEIEPRAPRITPSDTDPEQPGA